MNRTLPGIVLITLVLSSCSKHSSNPSSPPPPAPHYAYIGGYVTGANNIAQGVYWKINLNDNSVADPTPMTNSTNVSCISVSGNNVYMAGPSTTNSGSYWKNDTMVPVSGASQIDFVSASNGNVYTEGIDSYNTLAYWTNNTESVMGSTLPHVSATMSPAGILPANGNVYAIANISFWPIQENIVLYGSSAVEWINGQPDILDQGGFGGMYFRNVPGIVASGQDIYLASNYNQGDTAGWVGYRKDTTLVRVYTTYQLNPRVYAWGSGIAVGGSDVYLCGTAFSNNALQAVYWKNNTMNYLPNGSLAYAIAVAGSDVYVAGADNSGRAVVWKNSAIVTILPGVQPVAYCMTIP